jgi:hypothetical protein
MTDSAEVIGVAVADDNVVDRLGADSQAHHIVLEDGTGEPHIKKHTNGVATALDINKQADSVFRLRRQLAAIEMLDETVPAYAAVASAQRTVLIGQKHVDLVID